MEIRGKIVVWVIGAVFFVLILRLFSIQVLDPSYRGRASRNVIKTKTVVPPRGTIYNRYGKVYVSNSPIFDLTITPRDLNIPDTSLLLNNLEMEKAELEKGIAKAKIFSDVKESILARYIDPEEQSALSEQLWGFGGIDFHVSNKRAYAYPVGANFLGYISEVNKRDINSSDGYYQMRDMMGKSGIERKYEEDLRGEKGQKVILKDVYNREVGSYGNGRLDETAITGTDLMLGIDTDLQAFGEELMQNKRGSIVAIEPNSGEILAFVSSPSYNPGQLTGAELGRNWNKLQEDTLNPLFNRPLMAEYPPGSIYKVAMALAALNEGIITPHSYYGCGGGFKRNRGKPGCRFHITPLALKDGIKYSCNSFFAATYMDFLHSRKFENIYEAFNTWRKYMVEMGLGRKLGVDIPYEEDGLIPKHNFYDRIYGENRWVATTIISNAIGQGEILMTPLQMANMAALIANQGFYVTPHFVKARKKAGKNQKNVWEKISYDKNTTSIDKKHFQTVADAMEQVVATGTARRAFIEDIVVCGKTGTVENPHGEDHATFICFAPKENPKIAVAVIIENSGGGGGRWAAPTASLM
ncbi:MAG: penicillin-binding transpeptidase domain-containing protein, partial [Bacteroidota bacterium]